MTSTHRRSRSTALTYTRLVDDYYVAQALHSGHLSGDGDFTRRCSSNLLGELLGGATILLTTSRNSRARADGALA